MGHSGSKSLEVRAEDVEPLSRAEFTAIQYTWLELEDADTKLPPLPDATRTVSHARLAEAVGMAGNPGLGRVLAESLGAPRGGTVAFCDFWPRVGEFVRRSTHGQARTFVSVVQAAHGIQEPERGAVSSATIAALLATAHALARAAGMHALGARGDGDAPALNVAPLVTDALSADAADVDARDGAGSVSLDAFLAWLQGTLPLLQGALSAHVYARMLVPRTEFARSAVLRISYEGGDSVSGSTAVWQVPAPPFGRLERPSRLLGEAEVFALMHVSDALQGPWQLLYDSAEHGLSFNRVAHHLAGYAGPTLLVFRSAGRHVVGGFAAAPWKESVNFYGGPTCFVFSAKPHFHVYRPSSAACAENNFQYLNHSSPAHPHGLGMGGTRDKPRLWIDEDVERSRAGVLDLTFDMGPLLWRAEGGRDGDDGAFALDAVEAWGLGGEEAAAAQAEHRRQTDALVQRARKVDRGKFLENDFDKEFFFGKTFGEGRGTEQQQQ